MNYIYFKGLAEAYPDGFVGLYHDNSAHGLFRGHDTTSAFTVGAFALDSGSSLLPGPMVGNDGAASQRFVNIVELWIRRDC